MVSPSAPVSQFPLSSGRPVRRTRAKFLALCQVALAMVDNLLAVISRYCPVMEQSAQSAAIRPLIISAPFGNYVQPRDTTPTLGTFTALRRGGVANRIWRVIKTVRYYPRLRAWVNRIGLRNPGIAWLVERAQQGRVDVSDKLVSVHGFTAAEWYLLLDHMAELRPLGVELNMSCPNVGHIDWPPDLFERAVATGVTVIVKVPPVNYRDMVERAFLAGVRWFHCCNTLPNPGGGMSGKPLMPLSLQCIQELSRQPFFADLSIIGGGGIYQPDDIDAYARVGAARVAIATKLFNPVCLLTDRPIRPLIHRARQLLGDPRDGGPAPG